MEKFVKPRVVQSKCLEIAACRYNGVKITETFVAALMPFVETIPLCPEVDIGLGIPRDPIRIVKLNDSKRLVQQSTGKDFTDLMQVYVDSTLSGLEKIDGFLLKSRSPSCGVKDVKTYAEKPGAGVFNKGPGFFGAGVLEYFPRAAIEDEGRLNNFTIREHYLTKLFANARLRIAGDSGKMGELVKFQSVYKLVLMSYNQSVMRQLGSITANPTKKPFAEVFEAYSELFARAMQRNASYKSHINVLMHAFGYFSKHLNSTEKAVFLDTLERFRDSKIPLSAVLSVLKIWMARIDQPYLKSQVYFQPYPEELVEITDSGKGRSR